MVGCPAGRASGVAVRLLLSRLHAGDSGCRKRAGGWCGGRAADRTASRRRARQACSARSAVAAGTAASTSSGPCRASRASPLRACGSLLRRARARRCGGCRSGGPDPGAGNGQHLRLGPGAAHRCGAGERRHHRDRGQDAGSAGRWIRGTGTATDAVCVTVPVSPGRCRPERIGRARRSNSTGGAATVAGNCSWRAAEPRRETAGGPS